MFGLHSGDPDFPIDIPCGSCVGCRADYATAWAVRCYHESTLHEQSSFVTLTYADPAPPELSRADVQNFIKRLRRYGFTFRYFLVGEYGSKTHRPHYHALFFGQDWLAGSEAFGQYYVSPLLAKVWGLGHVVVAPAESNAIFYTAGYSLKNFGQDGVFHLSSRRPYIGAGWLRKYWRDIAQNGWVTIDGVRRSVPKRYLLHKEFASEFEPLLDARREHVRTVEKPDRGIMEQRSREINLLAKASSSRGSL